MSLWGRGEALKRRLDCPAYFCDFNHAVAYNGYNSAVCIYTGKQAGERVPASDKAPSAGS